ncbi:hypothetical protein DPMN_083384 [Dreissena polymorpha]|uniref:Uncharacterized protein n=1 Tax=Dreissena polymorpha TaxID=45954 RepID=A0A9D3YCH4_DREPO|nr:hypothetical protein DPMN_083384 [Dreissena polymorpha]
MSVGPSVGRYIDHDGQMTPIDFQVTRNIDHGLQMTPIDFQVTRSKVKATVTRNSENDAKEEVAEEENYNDDYDNDD